MVKFIVVTGGVLSGIGKGVIASSIGMLMRAYGRRATAIKIDPYVNIDAGTMSPFEHGEVYILDDGGEADLDLGNYERFMDLTLTRDNNITTGKIYQKVIEKERRGDYLGKTVQVVPHIVNEITDWITRVANIPADGSGLPPEVCVIELGGTVGDIESMPFIEAIRQLQMKVGRGNFALAHVSLVPLMGSEQKTKPTQHSVRELRSLGLNPTSPRPIEESVKEKLALFCQVDSPVRLTPGPPLNFTAKYANFEAIISVHDVSNLYRVPLLLKEQQLPQFLIQTLGLEPNHPNLKEWKTIAALADTLTTSDSRVRICVVGKYTGLTDAYHSVIKGLLHASLYAEIHVDIDWIEADNLEQDADASIREEALKRLNNANGILVPGGFGLRGIEGKIIAANIARTKKIPYFGICLGLQIAVIEFARSVLGWDMATSEEFVTEPHSQSPKNVVVNMPEISKTHMGGTMRLGSRKTVLQSVDSLAYKLYRNAKQLAGEMSFFERHRHRYEVNPEYVQDLSNAGLLFTGKDESGMRQEIIELPTSVHPFYFAVQYHPEMKSRPTAPSPPFLGFVLAASGKLNDAFTDSD